MRKSIIIILLLGTAAAQDGWTHSLTAPFTPPLDFLMLPWDGPAQPAGMNECWPDSSPPFLGSDYTFYCFEVGLDATLVGRDLRVAFGDAGLGSYYSVPVGNDEVKAVTLTPSFIYGDAVHAWVLQETGLPAYVTLAFRPGRDSLLQPADPVDSPSQLLEVPVPVVEPVPEPSPVLEPTLP